MWNRPVAGLWLTALLCGCSVEHFRAETELFSDGSVDRSIWQPLDETQRKQWPTVAQGMQDERLQTELWGAFDFNRPKRKDGKPANPKDDGVSARGKFASVKEIPEHYRKEASPGPPAATLQRKVEREDFVFVTEHRWEETLTDCVKLEEIPAARRALIDFVIPLFVETLRQELEPDCDVSALEPWLRDEGATWLDELISLYIDLSLRAGPSWVQDKSAKTQAEQRFQAINARHGLKSFDNEAIDRFVLDKAKQLIKQKDGTSMTEKLAAELASAISNSDSPQTPNRFERRSKKLITDKYSSEEIFQKQLHARLVPLIGLHSPFQFAPQEFDYRLIVPGFIVESNGELTSANRVRWRFAAAEAFPFGYSMRSRSLQSNDDIQRTILNDVPLKTGHDCERLVRLLRAKPEWLRVLQACVEQKSRQPLLDLRTRVLRRNDFTERLQFDDIGSLLKLEDN